MNQVIRRLSRNVWNWDRLILRDDECRAIRKWDSCWSVDKDEGSYLRFKDQDENTENIARSKAWVKYCWLETQS